jgi:hypothetical protein
LCKELGERGYNKLNTEFSAEHHYSKLITLFHKTVEEYAGLNKAGKIRKTEIAV